MSKDTTKQKFFLMKILEVLTHRIKSKVILFEIIIILLVAIPIGLTVTVFMESTLTQKAHAFSERILKDLSKSIEVNYISVPATEESVKSFDGIPGVLYLGYHGSVFQGEGKKQKQMKVHLYIGNPISDKAYSALEPGIKDLKGFSMSQETSDYNSKIVLRYLQSIYYGVTGLFTKKQTGINEEKYFEYYMPVTVSAGIVQKRLGTIVMHYSLSIIQKDIAQARILISIITLIITILGIYISIRGSNSIVKPIVQLTESVRLFSLGDMTIRVNMPVKDEIGVLARSFDEMIVTVREKLEMQKFVSDSTVKMIQRSVTDNSPTQHKDKHTERKDVTLFFSDIRGFTSMSEKLDPQEVVNILNQYLDVQSNIIKEHGGDIDKYVGDEIVAVFDSEDMFDKAVSAARKCQLIIKEMNNKREKEGLFPVVIGIGINSGEVVVGSIGSHDRMDFTVIGDNVNLAARLCSAAGKNEIIISKSVKDNLKDKQKLTPLEPISVKGKVKPIEVFRVEY